MIAHTPGPWSVPHFAEPESGCECGYVLTDGYAGAVCTVHCSGEGGVVETGDNPKFEEAKANARLIAAAPDLLGALIEVRNMIPYSRSNGIIAECRHCEGGAVSVEGCKRVPHTDACVISRIDAAIDRATGAP